METLPPARAHGPPRLQGPKATEDGAGQRRRRRGDETLDGISQIASLLESLYVPVRS